MMVDGKYEEHGSFIFIMRTTRLIVAMLVLVAICKPASRTVAIKGAQNLAPNCRKKKFQDSFVRTILARVRVEEVPC
uniref:Putative salp15 n=1 Tax=Ixodes ricinus TaxID=34613 RepID=A0A0K8REW6_IXORI